MGRRFDPDRAHQHLMYINNSRESEKPILIFISQFLFIFFASLGIGLQIKEVRNSLSNAFLVGFMFFTSLLSIIYLLIPKKLEISSGIIFWITFIFIVILWINIFRNSYLNMNFKNLLFQFAPLIMLLIIIPIYITQNIRYHSSPDNHGFGITTAYIDSNFSYNYLAQDYMAATGLDKPVFLGQKTPFLESTWHILDTQLRFASDMIFTVGRIGFPVLGAVVGSQFQIVDAFTSFVLILGILSMWCIGFLTLSLVKSIHTLLRVSLANGNHDGISNKNNNSNFLKIEVILQIAVSLSPWILIYVIEGAVTQIFMIVAVLWQMYISTEYISNDKRNFNLALYASPIFISVVYPSGFLFYLGFCGLFVLSLILIQKSAGNKSLFHSLKSNKHILYSMISILPITIYLTRYTFSQVIENFLKGANNRPYDLGPIPIFDLLPVYGQKIRPIAPQPNGQAFTPILDSASEGIIQLILVLVTICVLLLILILVRKKSGLFVSVLFVLPVILVYLPLRRLLNADELWYPYFYFRDLTLIASLAFPIVIAIIVFLSRAVVIRLNKKLLKAVFSLATITLVFNSTHTLLGNYKMQSKNFNVVKEYNFKENASSVLFVSDSPNHEFFVMAMYGKFHLLTDGWEPELISNINGTKFDVFNIDFDSKGNLVTMKIGTFDIEKNMKLGGVITNKDIQKIAGFQRS